MSFLLGLKAKLFAIGAVLLGIVGLILRSKYLAKKADRATHRAEVAESQIRLRNRIEEADSEIDREYSDLERERNKDEIPRNLSDPNSW